MANSGSNWGTFISNVHASSGVGLSNLSEDNGIKIYPNPFNDDVLITFSASIQNNSFTLKIANSIVS